MQASSSKEEERSHLLHTKPKYRFIVVRITSKSTQESTAADGWLNCEIAFGYNDIISDIARTVCGAGSIKRHGVRPSVCLSRHGHTAANPLLGCCPFADAGPAGRRYRSIAAAAACGDEYAGSASPRFRSLPSSVSSLSFPSPTPSLPRVHPPFSRVCR